MSGNRKIVEIDQEKCDGCGLCTTACAEGAIELKNGKAVLVKDSYCDGLGACLGECPRDAIRIIERTADPFDPEEVEHHLEHLRSQKSARTDSRHPSGELPLACGCPSTRMESFAPTGGGEGETSRPSASALSHWPVQIRLIPPTAPFLRDGSLLVAADCTPVAYPDFHSLIKGSAVMIGCPKFDDTDEYVARFTELFRQNDIQTVKIVIMEVPCCSRLPLIVRRGMELAGKNIPVELITIGTRGSVVRREKEQAA